MNQRLVTMGAVVAEQVDLTGDLGLSADLGAEEALIAGCLLGGKLIFQVLDRVGKDDFYHVPYRVIFGAMTELASASKPIELVSVCEQLQRNKDFELAGGTNTIRELLSGSTLGVNSPEYLAGVIRDHALRRRMASWGQCVARWACDPTLSRDQVLQKMNEGYSQITQSQADLNGGRTLGEVAVESFEKLEARAAQGEAMSGIPSGIHDYDHITDGFQPSDLLVLAGRPGAGKTALAVQWADTVASLGHTVVFFSLEMSRRQLGDRIIARRSGVVGSRIRKGNLNERQWGSVASTVGELGDLPFFIEDKSNITMSDLRARLMRYTLGSQSRLGLIVIDYLQLMDVSSYRGNRADAIGELSQGLKVLARDFDCTVLALAQMNRGVEARADKRPQLSDLRDSGRIEADADQVIFLSKDPADPSGSIVELTLAKHRSGNTGIIKTLFEPDLFNFKNLLTPGYVP